jgi:hypothetical protein
VGCYVEYASIACTRDKTGSYTNVPVISDPALLELNLALTFRPLLPFMDARFLWPGPAAAAVGVLPPALSLVNGVDGTVQPTSIIWSISATRDSYLHMHTRNGK